MKSEAVTLIGISPYRSGGKIATIDSLAVIIDRNEPAIAKDWTRSSYL
jgi:hypothetical protein